jgi:hypothetical protein
MIDADARRLQTAMMHCDLAEQRLIAIDTESGVIMRIAHFSFATAN